MTATDRRTHDDEPEEDGQLANPGPIPAEPEDVSDTGEKPGDLAPLAGGPANEHREPDLDPHLAPDPEHEVRENPPEGAGPR